MGKITGDQELSESELKMLEGEEPESDEQDDGPTVEDEPDPDEEQEEEQEESEEEESTEEPKQERDPSKKTVPHGAFHQEREKRKAAERSMAETRQKLDILSARFNDMLALVRGGGQESGDREASVEDQLGPAPDKHTEPFKYMEWLERKQELLDGRLAGVEQHHQQTAEQQKQQAEINRAIEFGNNLANQFASSLEDPHDYAGAFQYAYQKRFEQLRMLNFDDSVIPGMIEREKTNGMMMCLRQKINPGQYLYHFAKSLGYKEGMYKEWNQKGTSSKLEKVKEGQKKFKSLGGGGGGKTTEPGSAEDVARMSEEDFQKWLRKNPRGLKKLMTGAA